MADLVRARLHNGVEKNVHPAFAERFNLTVLDEPTRRDDGTLRRPTRKNGRAPKPKTSVAEKAAEKTATTVDATTPEEASE